MFKAFGKYPKIPIDMFGWFRLVGILKIYALKNNLCSVNDFDSTIEETGKRNKHKRILQRKIYQYLRYFLLYLIMPIRYRIFKKNIF